MKLAGPLAAPWPGLALWLALGRLKFKIERHGSADEVF
jgi:hypothetical protein